VSEVILPLKMQGIAEITEHAIVFRFKFTARPVKPSWVQREYLKQIYRVFAEKGIIFASGALTLQTARHGRLRRQLLEAWRLRPRRPPKPEPETEPALTVSTARGAA
jgi:hypothetical protein